MPHRHNRRSSCLHAFHHVMSRGGDRQAIATRRPDRTSFVECLGDLSRSHDATIHAWCLMDNHYHLILEAPQGNLTATIHTLNKKWGQMLFSAEENKSVPISTTVPVHWQSKSILIDADRYLVSLSRYIHRNPVRSKLSAHPGDYPWSSYRAYAGISIPPPWLYTDTILGMFSADQNTAREAYRQFVEEPPQVPQEQELRRLLCGEQEKWGQILFSAKENKSVPISRHGNIPLDTILSTVAHRYLVPEETLLDKGHKRNHARDTALYLATHLSGLPMHMVGRAFGGIKPPAVAMRCQAVRERSDNDTDFRSDLEAMTARLRNKQ